MTHPTRRCILLSNLLQYRQNTPLIILAVLFAFRLRSILIAALSRYVALVLRYVRKEDTRLHREYNLVLLFLEGDGLCITFLSFWWLPLP